MLKIKILFVCHYLIFHKLPTLISKTKKMITENEKLFIEKFKKSDISEWSKIESDLRVRHFVDGKKQTYKQSEEYIKKNILSYDINGFGRYTVRLKKNKQLIGMCGFLEEDYGIDFGYRYTPSVWRNGIGFDVAKLVLNYGIKKLKLYKILALAHEDNHGSIRILEKLDFIKKNKIILHKQNTYIFKLEIKNNL